LVLVIAYVFLFYGIVVKLFTIVNYLLIIIITYIAVTGICADILYFEKN